MPPSRLSRSCPSRSTATPTLTRPLDVTLSPEVLASLLLSASISPVSSRVSTRYLCSILANRDRSGTSSR
ncbi:uncharacterized protein J3R85_007704 [Psidium guajava]|nr:uncharacterized protein J3R85_007704 [Psidium guajava]